MWTYRSQDIWPGAARTFLRAPIAAVSKLRGWASLLRCSTMPCRGRATHPHSPPPDRYRLYRPLIEEAYLQESLANFARTGLESHSRELDCFRRYSSALARQRLSQSVRRCHMLCACLREYRLVCFERSIDKVGKRSARRDRHRRCVVTMLRGTMSPA